jgi:hypothetical protein
VCRAIHTEEIMTYNRACPTIGVTGRTHQSAAEAEASFCLAPLGILPHDFAYPVTFTDADGTTFTARSDFRHEATGVLFEFKAGPLNGRTTKQAADSAVARVSRAEALGYVNATNRTAKLLDAQWNHSRHKLKAVVNAMNPAKCVLLVKDIPTDKELAKLDRAGIFVRHVGSMRSFALFLKLAAAGLGVGFTDGVFRFGMEASA